MPVSELQKAGHQVFLARCSVCHTVRGTPARGSVGPDLTHLMDRQTIAAGTLPNQPGTLGTMIVSAQTIKPGSRMPNILMPGTELQQILAYLGTLQ